MIEISYLNYLVRAISVSTGWRVLVLEIASSSLNHPVYRSSALYSTEVKAIRSGIQFIQRQKVLSALWNFIYYCYASNIITEIELDRLSESLYLFCCFEDFQSGSDYWYR